MVLKTEFLGEIEVDEEQIYTFEEGVYGFPDSRRFAFIGQMTPEFPFIWMQSLEEDEAVFVVTNPFLFKEDYDFEIAKGTVESLGLEGLEQAGVYTMVIIPEDVKEVTANLKSPVILNLQNKKGRQVILNENYPYKYRLFKQTGDTSC